MMTSKTKYKSEAILLFVTILWGGTFVIVKEALNDISSMAFISVRFSIAGIIFSFEPIFSAIFAFFILGEIISNFGYFGAALIMLGLLISEVYENIFLKNGK